ncbi:MAG: hypothetical protein ACREMY_23450 [bacterium]
MEIRNISVDVRRTVPIGGTRVHHPTGGANSALLLRFDLDEDNPKAWQWTQDGGMERTGTEPYFDQGNITITKDEIQPVVVVVHTQASHCRWRLMVEGRVGTRTFSRVIAPPEDGWFETSGDPDDGFKTVLLWAWFDGHRLVPDDVP